MSTEIPVSRTGATNREVEASGKRVLVLTENTRMGGETGAGIMCNRCTFTSRDMAHDWPEAFTYAVVCGWGDGDEDDAWYDVAEKFGWDAELVAFLRETHRRFEELADRQAAR